MPYATTFEYPRPYMTKTKCPCPKHDNHNDCEAFNQCLADAGAWRAGHKCYFACECPLFAHNKRK
jgi:hypothetical protein